MICLIRSVKKYNDQITIGLIYQQYKEFGNSKTDFVNFRTNLDQISIKKILEELSNSNLITIKNHEKYLVVYELKHSVEIEKQYIIKLYNDQIKNIDNNMKNYVNF